MVGRFCQRCQEPLDEFLYLSGARFCSQQCYEVDATEREEERHKKFCRLCQKDEVFQHDGYRCVICGSTENLTIDHILPRAKGGKDELSNLQTLCRRCNSKKGAKHPYVA